MASSFYDLFREINFFEMHLILINSQYYELIFPFLLVYAILYTVLCKIKIFQNKKTGQPIKSIIATISLIISIYGVTYETSAGYNVGSLLMMMFPNISAITMMTLCLYIVGSLLGRNFFYGIFRKDIDGFAYYAVGAIGLGAVVFYTGIVMGFWDANPLSITSYWNVVFAVAFLILGIVFAITGQFILAFIFLYVVISYIFGNSNEGILNLFIDPFVFIFLIFGFLFNWITGDSKGELSRTMRDQERLIQEYEKANGGKLPDYKSRIYDGADVGFENNKKKWEKLFPNDPQGWKR